MNDLLAGMKQMARTVWAAGDFDEVSKLILPVGEGVVKATAVGPGDTVLDVACGTGNATIPAARTGATVTGLDITAKLLEDAQRNADEAGVEINFVEGDAEDLPFDDESFDVVVSTFGCMFAPRHDVAAAEIARVLKPGGRLAIAAWTPEGGIGAFFTMMAGHMPPPPPGVATGPPIMWGTEDHVRSIFEGSGIDFSFSRGLAEMTFATIDGAAEFYSSRFGPMVMAKAALEPQGKWDGLLEDVKALYASQNEATDGSLLLRHEYLRITGTKA